LSKKELQEAREAREATEAVQREVARRANMAANNAVNMGKGTAMNIGKGTSTNNSGTLVSKALAGTKGSGASAKGASAKGTAASSAGTFPASSSSILAVDSGSSGFQEQSDYTTKDYTKDYHHSNTQNQNNAQNINANQNQNNANQNQNNANQNNTNANQNYGKNQYGNHNAGAAVSDTIPPVHRPPLILRRIRRRSGIPSTSLFNHNINKYFRRISRSSF
jgi:hypothetical protein